MLLSLVALASALAVATSAAPSGAFQAPEDPPVAEVIVTVFDPDGNPAQGVRVVCDPAPPGEEDEELRTDADGVVEFYVEPGQELRFHAWLWTSMRLSDHLAGVGRLGPLRADDVRSLTIHLSSPPPRLVAVSVIDSTKGRALPQAEVAFVKRRQESSRWDKRPRTPFGSLGFVSVEPLERDPKGLWMGTTALDGHECIAVLCEGYAAHVEVFSFTGQPTDEALRLEVSLQEERSVDLQVSGRLPGTEIYAVTHGHHGSKPSRGTPWLVTYPAQQVDEGRYRLRQVPKGEDAYVVAVRNGEVLFIEELPKAETAGDHVRTAVELASAARVRGSVQTRTGRALAGVDLELRHSATGAREMKWLFAEQGPVATARTRPDGAFEFEPVPRGTYVVALAEGIDEGATPWVAEEIFCDVTLESDLVVLRAFAPKANHAQIAGFELEGRGTIVATAKKDGVGRSCPVRAMLTRKSDGATLNAALSGKPKSRIVFGRLPVDDYSVVAVARGGWISPPTDISILHQSGMSTCSVALKRGAELRLDCGAVDRSVEVTVRSTDGHEYRHVVEGLTAKVTIPAGAVEIEAKEIGGSSMAQWTVSAAAGETIERAMPPSGALPSRR